MNDLMRSKLAKPDGSMPLWSECLSGGIVSIFHQTAPGLYKLKVLNSIEDNGFRVFNSCNQKPSYHTRYC